MLVKLKKLPIPTDTEERKRNSFFMKKLYIYLPAYASPRENIDRMADMHLMDDMMPKSFVFYPY